MAIINKLFPQFVKNDFAKYKSLPPATTLASIDQIAAKNVCWFVLFDAFCAFTSSVNEYVMSDIYVNEHL